MATAKGATRPNSVEIVEVGPRDGLQNDKRHLTVEERIALIRRLAAAGLTRIEAVSFVNPARVPQMADGEKVLAGLADLAGVSLSGLVLNARGFERALAAGLREISFVATATDTMAAKNQASTADGLVAQWAGMAGRAKAAGMFRSVAIAVSFGCPFEGEVPVARVIAVARRLAEAGLDEIALADTIGVATPSEVEEKFSALREAVPGVPMRAHFHNTRNTGYANADAALRAGVTVLDASIGGLGGCPFAPGATGNIATEDLLYMLEREGVRTGIGFDRLLEVNAWLGELMDRRLPGQVAHVRPFPAELAA